MIFEIFKGSIMTSFAVNNSIFYLPLQGKPDHRLPREIKENRPFVEQQPQQGAACWYYAVKKLREQYGHYPDPSLKERRELEKKVSDYRTEIEIAYEQTWNAQIRNEIEMDCGCKNILEIHQCFIKSLHIDYERAFYRDQRSQRWKRVDWNQLAECKQMAYLANLAIRICLFECYKLRKSSWKPSHPITRLIRELKSYRWIMLHGRFGKHFYQQAPKSKLNQILGRTIWYWEKDSPQKEAGFLTIHSVVVIGASKGKAKGGGVVYFVDPQDGSHPERLEQQKIYEISYQNLIDHVSDLFGERYNPKDHVRSIYGVTAQKGIWPLTRS